MLGADFLFCNYHSLNSPLLIKCLLSKPSGNFQDNGGRLDSMQNDICTYLCYAMLSKNTYPCSALVFTGLQDVLALISCMPLSIVAGRFKRGIGSLITIFEGDRLGKRSVLD